MPVTEGVGQPAVHLLRPGSRHVARAQPRLDVPHGNPCIERGQRRGQDGGRVALHQHAVRTGLLQHAPHSVQYRAGDAGEVLPRGHHVQIIVGFEVEQPQHRVQHLSMLRRDAKLVLDAACALQGTRHHGHLYGLRSRPHYGQNSHVRHAPC